MIIGRKTAWIVAYLVALVPACALVICLLLGDQQSPVFKISLIYYLPALSIGALVKSFFGQGPAVIAMIVTSIAWSSFVAYGVQHVIGLLGDRDFDWKDFRVGMVVGAIPGAVIGWRMWIPLSKTVGLVACMIVCALLCGFVLGAYMGICWKRFR